MRSTRRQDRKGAGILRHGTTKVSLLFLPGKANHGDSYYNLLLLYGICRQQELSISRVSIGYSKPPASTRADYCPLTSYSNAD
jgi:hypothetical protein